jgi:hypothetical protein
MPRVKAIPRAAADPTQTSESDPDGNAAGSQNSAGSSDESTMSTISHGSVPPDAASDAGFDANANEAGTAGDEDDASDVGVAGTPVKSNASKKRRKAICQLTDSDEDDAGEFCNTGSARKRNSRLPGDVVNRDQGDDASNDTRAHADVGVGAGTNNPDENAPTVNSDSDGDGDDDDIGTPPFTTAPVTTVAVVAAPVSDVWGTGTNAEQVSTVELTPIEPVPAQRAPRPLQLVRVYVFGCPHGPAQSS